MAHAAPLHRLAHGQGHVEADRRHYPAVDIALRVIELTLECDGLTEQVTTPWLVERIAPALAQLDQVHGVPSEGNAARHLWMVERVLQGLRNDAERREEFVETVFDPMLPPPHERVVRFRLLEDRHHPAGGVTIRPTAEATNLYLGALDHDLASLQLAAEAMLQFQLDRGALDAAEGAARDARKVSRRHLEVITRLLDETDRDVGLVDWAEAAPMLLRQAQAHVSDRIAAESHLIGEAGRRLDTLENTSDAHRQLVQIRDIVRATRGDHLRLMETLASAHGRFLDAQARQRFRPPVAQSVPDLRHEVLAGALRRAPAALDGTLERLLSALLPPSIPAVWSPEVQLGWNLAEARRSDDEADLLPDDDTLESLPPELLAFPPGIRSQGEAVLAQGLAAAGPEGVALSALLQPLTRAQDPTRDAVAHYVALRSLWAADTEPPAAADATTRHTGLTPLRAASTGERLLVGPFGGTDLHLTLHGAPAPVVSMPAAPLTPDLEPAHGDADR